MAAVKIHTGDFPSAEGAKDGADLGRIVARWQSVASDAFPRDCSWLLRMVEETDRLRLWERDVDGFTYACRDEFLREKVLIDFDLTEQQVKDLVVALKGGASGGIEDLCREARNDPLPEHRRPTIEERMYKGKERMDKGSNTTFNDRGQAYTVRRLARDRPDLLDRVESGELSPNAAAIEAGFRRPMKSVPIDTPEAAIRALMRVFSIDDLLRAVGMIADGA